MTLSIERSNNYASMVNATRGTVDRRIFFEQEIYEMELERIFARAWNFLAHDSQLAKAGDFFLTYIGEDRIIAVRDKDGGVQCLVNSCRHRGNAVCRAEEGHATSFMCTYHGWTYDLKGNLVGVPGFKEVYHEDLQREEWGLIKAAQVDNYKGFWFATMDPKAPSLGEYLGDVGRMAIDMLAMKGKDVIVADGVQKYTIGCNWKFAVDNVWDFYHNLTHQSSSMARWRNTPVRPGQLLPNLARPNISNLGEYGHVVGGPAYDENAPTGNPDLSEEWRKTPEAMEALGPVGIKTGGHPHIFPNFWVCQHNGLGQVSLRLPKGPAKTEIWWFTFLDRTAPQDHKKQLHISVHTFGPAGMLEQDDGENWGQSTIGQRGAVARRFPLNYAMNLGRGQVIEDELGPPRVESVGVTEHPQLWHYRSWAAWMAAENWADLKADHPIPHGTV